VNKEEYHIYLQSAGWKNIRKQKIAEANNRCEICGYKKTLEIHHLNYNTIGNENLNDLQVVCHDCHQKIHTITSFPEPYYEETISNSLVMICSVIMFVIIFSLFINIMLFLHPIIDFNLFLIIILIFPIFLLGFSLLLGHLAARLLKKLIIIIFEAILKLIFKILSIIKNVIYKMIKRN